MRRSHPLKRQHEAGISFAGAHRAPHARDRCRRRTRRTASAASDRRRTPPASPGRARVDHPASTPNAWRPSASADPVAAPTTSSSPSDSRVGVQNVGSSVAQGEYERVTDGSTARAQPVAGWRCRGGSRRGDRRPLGGAEVEAEQVVAIGGIADEHQPTPSGPTSGDCALTPVPSSRVTAPVASTTRWMRNGSSPTAAEKSTALPSGIQTGAPERAAGQGCQRANGARRDVDERDGAGPSALAPFDDDRSAVGRPARKREIDRRLADQNLRCGRLAGRRATRRSRAPAGPPSGSCRRQRRHRGATSGSAARASCVTRRR